MHCIANVYIQNYHIDDEITIISVHIWFFFAVDLRNFVETDLATKTTK